MKKGRRGVNAQRWRVKRNNLPLPEKQSTAQHSGTKAGTHLNGHQTAKGFAIFLSRSFTKEKMSSPPTSPRLKLHATRDYSTVNGIDTLDTPPTYSQFIEHYLEPNLPVLIGPALTTNWRARQQWVCPVTGKPNFDNLREQLCSNEPIQVPVADCQCKDFTDQKRSTMDLKGFLDEWEEHSRADRPSRTYLKDFHFVKTFPDYGAYETPDIFCDDWMNEFWTRRTDMDDDYRFVYCGGDGTFTPFHADVYRYVPL